MKDARICKNCAFFKEDRNKGASIGWCWSQPPQVVVRKTQDVSGNIREVVKTVRPISAAQDFCSYWASAEGDNRRDNVS